MSVVLTRLAHPGPPAPDRRQAAGATLRPLVGRLAAGRTVMAEVAALFAAHGCRGGIVWLDGVACEPMRFVLPALATDGEHAAFYSETHAPDGVVRIGPSTASVGRRDGAAFLHCHGQWSGAFGTAMGHLLPFELDPRRGCGGARDRIARRLVRGAAGSGDQLHAVRGGRGRWRRRADRAAAARRGCLRRRRGALRRARHRAGAGAWGRVDLRAAVHGRPACALHRHRGADRRRAGGGGRGDASTCRWWTWMAGSMPDASQGASIRSG